MVQVGAVQGGHSVNQQATTIQSATRLHVICSVRKWPHCMRDNDASAADDVDGHAASMLLDPNSFLHLSASDDAS